jgi:hypothetical protein
MHRSASLVVAAAVAFSVTLAPRSASACGGALFDADMMMVHRATRALEQGEYAHARQLAAAAEKNAATEAIAARARRVATMAS